MDIVSHGLWGAIAFGRKNRKIFWTAFFIGISPDVFSFGMLWLANLLGISPRPDWSQGPPPAESIPSYISHLYNATHSLVVFFVIFLLIWAVRRKPLWILGAWAVHIIIDIPSHSTDFFATPFLWPISNFKVNGIHWGNSVVYFPNLALLAILYLWFLAVKLKQRKLN